MRLLGLIGLGCAGLVLASACTNSTPTPAPAPPVAQTTPAGTAAAPVFEPGNFVTVVDNPFFPLKPGTVWVYEGIRDEQTQRDEVAVTNRTKVVDGVTAVVVTDVATHAGELLEKTEDWYAQDKQGNVWYLGEDTASYSNGKVESREGSWTAGVDGAVPGIIMPAHPGVPFAFRQEYLRDHAEDTSWVVDEAQTVKVPYGTLTGAIRTLEFSRLEPEVVDTKYYAPGIGIVREVSLSGPKENADLVSFKQG